MIPEPLTIASATVGLLGFALSAKAVIEKLLSEIDAVKSHSSEFVPFKSRIGLQRRELQIWMQFWRIHKGAPERLFVAYWGKQGSQELRDLVSQIHRDIRKLRKEFRSKYKAVIKDEPFRLLPDESVMQSLVREFKHDSNRITSKLKSLRTALFTGTIFQSHLKLLEDNVKLLVDDSRTRFIATNLRFRGTAWEKQVHPAGNKIHLTELALRSAADSEVLRRQCCGLKDHGIDFRLSHGTSFDDRFDSLSECAREGRLVYYLYVSQLNAPADVLGISCEGLRKADREEAPCAIELSQALHILFVDREFAHPQFPIQLREDTASFVLGPMSGEASCKQRKSLRSVMTARGCNEEERDDFFRYEQPLLAYELAECGLIFLKTHWFSNLCSCSIQRIEDASGKTSFTVRIGQVQHMDTDLAHAADPIPWCKEDLRDMHIRRLGVVLAEVGLQTVVDDVSYDSEAHEILIKLPSDHASPNVPTIFRAKEIGKQLRRKTSEDFRDAVQYCLEEGTPPDNICQQNLDDFYGVVVAPLFLHYEGQRQHTEARLNRRRQAATT